MPVASDHPSDGSVFQIVRKNKATSLSARGPTQWPHRRHRGGGAARGSDRHSAFGIDRHVSRVHTHTRLLLIDSRAAPLDGLCRMRRVTKAAYSHTSHCGAGAHDKAAAICMRETARRYCAAKTGSDGQ